MSDNAASVIKYALFLALLGWAFYIDAFHERLACAVEAAP